MSASPMARFWRSTRGSAEDWAVRASRVTIADRAIETMTMNTITSSSVTPCWARRGRSCLLDALHITGIGLHGDGERLPRAARGHDLDGRRGVCAGAVHRAAQPIEGELGGTGR